MADPGATDSGATLDPFATRENFQVDGHDAFVLAPETARETPAGKPWVWYAPTLGKKHPSQGDEGWMFERFHRAGIAIAGVDVGESYGSPKGRAGFDALYKAMTERGYSKKPVLLARSRGGLMLYNWACDNPGSVGGIAGIYPVCNLTSYPGLDKAAPAYGMTADALKAKLAEHNPIDRLAPLAEARVPIFHLQGDSDTVVPHEDNTAIVAERYEKLGGPMRVKMIEGGGHDVKRVWFTSEPLVNFVVLYAINAPGNPADPAENKKLFRLPGMLVDLANKHVDVDAKVCLNQGYLEFVACTPDSKEHESIVVVDAKPQHIHAGLLLIGLQNGNPAMQKRIGEGDEARWIHMPARGAEVEVCLVFPDRMGREMEYPIGDFISWADDDADGMPREVDVEVDEQDKVFPKSFLFAGSHIVDTPDGQRRYIADESGHVISIATFGDEVICLAGKHSAETGALVWEINPELLPKVGTKVKLRIRKYTPAPGDIGDE